jgi:predicted secreted protein
MIRDVPKGASALDAAIGRSFELALPGAGTTGFRWQAKAVDGVEVRRLPVVRATSFGGASRDIFEVTARKRGDISLRWELRAPWEQEPAETREVLLKIR